jgi:hypothetical protein
MRPRFAFISRPLEGVGNAGCPLHPRPRVHFVLVESTRVTTSTPESPGIPARNGFTTYFVLPGDRALLPPSLAECAACPRPVGPTCLPQNLTPASGRQDHTILPSAASISRQRAVDRSQVPKNPPCNPIARKTLPRPPHPAPTSVTIAKRPSVWDGMRNVLDVIWGVRKQKYFCIQDWTGQITLIQFNKFGRACKRRGGVVS